jgi:predicted transcriptional regulator
MDREPSVDERLALIKSRLEQARFDLVLLRAAVSYLPAMPRAAKMAEPVLPLASPASSPPVMPVENSISPDGRFIYCLIDGKRLQMLRKYLRRFGHTPASYRAAFDLPPDYPMTAPSYSARKREEAFRVGLGTKLNRSGMNLNGGATSACETGKRKVA